MKKSKHTTPLGQRIREAREAAGLARREVVAMVPALKGDGDLLQLENNGKHCDSHAIVEAVMAALKMPR